MAVGAGQRDRLVQFRLPLVTRAALGGEVETFVNGPQAWAKVLFGTSSERRDAAGEGSAQTATFRVRATSALRAITGRCQIVLGGATYGVDGPPVAVGSQGHDLEFSATMRDI